MYAFSWAVVGTVAAAAAGAFATLPPACDAAVVVSDIPANAQTLPHGIGAAVEVNYPAVPADAVAACLTPEGQGAALKEGYVGRANVVERHAPQKAARALTGMYDLVPARRASCHRKSAA